MLIIKEKTNNMEKIEKDKLVEKTGRVILLPLAILTLLSIEILDASFLLEHLD